MFFSTVLELILQGALPFLEGMLVLLGIVDPLSVLSGKKGGGWVLNFEK